MSALWDRELKPPPEWPLYRGPESDVEEAFRFTLRLPRGWTKIVPKSSGALFAAMSQDCCVDMELFIGAFDGRSKLSGAEMLAGLEKVTVEGLSETHSDVREIWRGNGGNLTGGACRRQIIAYREKEIHTTTDYFYLANADVFISANFKTNPRLSTYLAGLFERITRGISNSKLGSFTIFQRNPCPMLACGSAPAGWIPCHYDPFAFKYPSEWQEAPRERALLSGTIEFIGSGGTRFMCMLCDSKLEGKSCEGLLCKSREGLFLLGGDLHGAWNENEMDEYLAWEGEIPQSIQGRCIRAIYKVPLGVRPAVVRDIIVMGSRERVMILRLDTRASSYNEIVPVFEAIAKTAVIGPLGPFTIDSRRNEL